jgi:hypothetical protein
MAGGLNEIPEVAERVLKHGDRAIRLGLRLPDKVDAFRLVGSEVASEVIRVQEEEDSATALVPDAGALCVIGCASDQEMSLLGARRGDYNPAFVLSWLIGVFDQGKAKYANIEGNCGVIVWDYESYKAEVLWHRD